MKTKEENKSVLKITMPLHIEFGKKKIRKYYMNINSYRNMHYQISNKLKIEYKKIVKQQLSP